MKNSKVYSTIAAIIFGIYFCIITFTPYAHKFPYTLYCVISWILFLIFIVMGSNAMIKENVQKLKEECERENIEFNFPGIPFGSAIKAFKNFGKAFKNFGKACLSVEKITNSRGQDATPPGERPDPPPMPPQIRNWDFNRTAWNLSNCHINTDHYSTYEQSQRLMEYILYDPLSSVFWMIDPSDVRDMTLVSSHSLLDAHDQGWKSTGIPAFNIYDLLPILPTEVKEKESYHEENDLRYTAFWSCRHASDGRFVSEYIYYELDSTLCKYVSDNLAECLAENLIVLFEEGYLKK